MALESSRPGILRTVGAYALLLVVLHPIALILLGCFGILVTAPTTGFGPSIMARLFPELERTVSIISVLAIGIGSAEIVFYYKILPRIRGVLS
ncbi:hypothetical protein [Halobellus rufus]|uniref:hypothetical protein n=1 Tax=Halobellus rufus TaxID=1448860 RepID=UPI0012E0A75A|nr:hypothetical protein [Halobellus rufus]